MLKDIAEQAHYGSKSLALIRASGGPLDQVKSALEELASRLALSEGLKRASRVLSWPSHKSEIKEILSRIERQKSLFALTLEKDHLGISRAVGANVSVIQEHL